jgi:ribosome-binding factor A
MASGPRLFHRDGRRESRRNTENQSRAFLRRELGRRLGMRYVPDILFSFDSSLEYGNRIETLLKEIHTEDDDGRGDPEAD